MIESEIKEKNIFYFKKHPKIDYIITDSNEKWVNYKGLDGTHTFVGICEKKHFLNITELVHIRHVQV